MRKAPIFGTTMCVIDGNKLNAIGESSAAQCSRMCKIALTFTINTVHSYVSVCLAFREPF